MSHLPALPAEASRTLETGCLSPATNPQSTVDFEAWRKARAR